MRNYIDVAITRLFNLQVLEFYHHFLTFYGPVVKQRTLVKPDGLFALEHHCIIFSVFMNFII